MRYGLVMRTDVPLRTLPELASEAELAGWDGFFLWDAFLGPNAWVLLAAIAMKTERLSLGTMLTAPSRRRPWQLASEVVTLDHLSNGCVILCFGLGAAEDLGFGRVGEETDRRLRAELMDETIDILNGLYTGQPISYNGKHYQLDHVAFSPAPLHHIPLWVVGAWPKMKSMQRVLRCDGCIPAKATPDGIISEVTPEDLAALKTFIDQNRSSQTPFDLVIEGETPGNNRDKAMSLIQPFANAGATWWLECVAAGAYKRGGLEDVRTRIQQGPPRLL